MKRTAILIEKSMPIGAVANISAIIMGQLSLLDNDLYSCDPVHDVDGNLHSSIKYSIVILKAGKGQLILLCDNLNRNYASDSIKFVLFTEIGQSLNNCYDDYSKKICVLSSKEAGIVGIGITGDDNVIRSITKKYSLM